MGHIYEVQWGAVGALLDRQLLAPAIRAGTARALKKLRARFDGG